MTQINIGSTLSALTSGRVPPQSTQALSYTRARALLSPPPPLYTIPPEEDARSLPSPSPLCPQRLLRIWGLLEQILILMVHGAGETVLVDLQDDGGRQDLEVLALLEARQDLRWA